MDNCLHIDRSTVAKDWHARGFSCGMWIDHAGREWSYQVQKTDELFMMMSGALELELEGLSIQPSVGEEIRIPAGMPHTIRNIGGNTARWLYGQVREVPSETNAPAQVRDRSFHPELKRKRRPEKRTPPINVSKEI
ncbi:MAG: cupin domain-containing protein [Nitrospirota bacterium]|nr:cupin domain-containing protein [Nitrospirota bacterium]